MKLSRFIASFFFLLPLAVRATPVEYAVGNGVAYLLDFTVPDFIPNIPTETPNHWDFSQTPFTGLYCNHPQAVSCTQLAVDIMTDPFDQVTFSFNFDTRVPYRYSFFLPGSDLSHPGRYNDGGGYEFFVFGSAAPTPEPVTVALTGSSLLLLGFLRIRKAKSTAKV